MVAVQGYFSDLWTLKGLGIFRSKIVVWIEFLVLSPLCQVHFLDLLGVFILHTGQSSCVLDFETCEDVVMDKLLSLTISDRDIVSFIFPFFGLYSSLFFCTFFLIL